MSQGKEKELDERSPLRLLDRSMHGGLGRGNLGVVCAGAGAGKTAVLVAMALDHLMRDQHVMHVALDQPVDRVRNYYDEIFAETARSEHLEDPALRRARLERNRRIHAYPPRTFRVDKLSRTISLFGEHTGVNPDLIVVDGYGWGPDSEDDLRALKDLAREFRSELWMTATIDRDRPIEHPRGYPEPVASFEQWIDVLLRLKGANGTVHLHLLKDHQHPVQADVAIDLDPTTLLLKKVGG